MIARHGEILVNIDTSKLSLGRDRWLPVIRALGALSSQLAQLCGAIDPDDPVGNRFLSAAKNVGQVGGNPTVGDFRRSLALALRKLADELETTQEALQS